MTLFPNGPLASSWLPKGSECWASPSLVQKVMFGIQMHANPSICTRWNYTNYILDAIEIMKKIVSSSCCGSSSLAVFQVSSLVIFYVSSFTVCIHICHLHFAWNFMVFGHPVFRSYTSCAWSKWETSVKIIYHVCVLINKCHQFLQYFILYQLWIVDLKYV